jgi:hypothetical protein
MVLIQKYEQAFVGRDSGNSGRRDFARNVEIFSGCNCIPTKESLLILLALPTLAQTIHKNTLIHMYSTCICHIVDWYTFLASNMTPEFFPPLPPFPPKSSRVRTFTSIQSQWT